MKWALRELRPRHTVKAGECTGDSFLVHSASHRVTVWRERREREETPCLLGEEQTKQRITRASLQLQVEINEAGPSSCARASARGALSTVSHTGASTCHRDGCPGFYVLGSFYFNIRFSFIMKDSSVDTILVFTSQNIYSIMGSGLDTPHYVSINPVSYLITENSQIKEKQADLRKPLCDL